MKTKVVILGAGHVGSHVAWALAAGGVLLSASGAKALEHKDSKKDMKVLLINGSPRPKGNTSIALAEVAKQLEKNEIMISATDDAVNLLAEIGFDPAMGARPVKRVIQRQILNELSKQILEEKIRTNDNITIDVIDDQFVFYNGSLKN